MSVFYTARANVTGGRDGRARTDDGLLDVLLQLPAKNATATNPEQLFAAGYGACFLSALNLTASQHDVDAEGFEIDCRVDLLKHDDDWGLAVKLNARMPGVDDETAEQLLREAHQICPYSKATRGNIDVSLFAGDRSVTQATG